MLFVDCQALSSECCVVIGMFVRVILYQVQQNKVAP